MSDYISYQELPALMGIEKGDIILLSSDITDLYIQCRKHGEKLDLNVLLDKFQEAIGPEGTLLIPTYNWGFCKGKTFDYKNSPSKTGVIGDTALKRKDFRRTKHPIYSFAVWGKDIDYLCSLDDVESFGPNSPFAYLEKNHGKNAFIGGASLRNCFTYIHQEGKESEQEYAMYVRDLDIDVVCAPDPFVDILYEQHLVKSGYINGVLYEIINFDDVTPIIEKDILYNRSKNLCTYKGQ